MTQGSKLERSISNALFRAGPNVDLNACVGTNGGPYDLQDYGRGFFLGGQAIVEAAKERRLPVDLAIYPAAFSFRHGIELYLKVFLNELLIFSGSKLPPRKSHGLLKYLELISSVLSEIEAPLVMPHEFAEVVDIVTHFNDIDPTGQVFRYPEDIRGNMHLAGLSLVNVEVLGSAMDLLRELMEGWIFHLRDLDQYRIENLGA